MEKEILKLRNEGKTYNEIRKILGCSKSTISYYCGNGQKEKNKERSIKRRKNQIISKLERFRNGKNIYYSLRKFQKRNGRDTNKNITMTFTWIDVLNKFGENTNCYMSGEPINLFENNYSLDHIIPSSKGGNNSLENLGILNRKVNEMKSDLSIEEMINWCIKILNHNGYKVEKILK